MFEYYEIGEDDDLQTMKEKSSYNAEKIKKQISKIYKDLCSVDMTNGDRKMVEEYIIKLMKNNNRWGGNQ